MLLDDVRAALDEEAKRVPPADVRPHEVLRRARSAVRFRRFVRVTRIVVVLVVAIACVFALGNRHDKSTEVVVAGFPTTVPVPASPAFTPAQLDAHVGKGAPAGWVPVDAGDARVFVPSTWFFEGPGVCIGGGSVKAMVRVGRGAASCSAPALRDAVSLIPRPTGSTGRFVEAVHSYRVYEDPSRPDPSWTAYDVPQLGIELVLRGAQQSRILATLAPSAWRVALAFATQSAPSGHVVEGDGIRVTIPASWPVVTPDMQPCGWAVAADGGPELVRIRPDIGSPPCAPPPENAAYAVHDDVYLHTQPGVTAPAGREPLVVLHHGTTTIRAFTEDPAELDLYVQDGRAPAHEIEIGLGRDGRVAGGILASIEATS